MIRIPQSVKVGPYKFSVRCVRQKDLKDSNAIGFTDFERFEIKIAKYLPRQKKQEVLLHEVIHACHHVRDSGVEEPMIRTDEQWITAIVPILLLVLRENPLLMEYLH